MGLLKDEHKQLLLNLQPDDITAEFIYKYLTDRAKTVNGKVVIQPSIIKTSDTFTLEAKEYFNKEKVLTNVGLFIYNKFIVEEVFVDVLGYINKPIDSKVHGDIESKISQALLDDKVTVEQVVTYLNKIQWIGNQFNTVFSNSLTMKTIKPLPKVMKLKKKLVSEHKKELEEGNPIVGASIEKQLIDAAKEELKDDVGLRLYSSGARGSVENNYKNIAVVKGPIYNPVKKKWDFVESNFMEGIKKEEIPVVANSIPMGAYPKAVSSTIEAGVINKQLSAAYQSVVLDEIGSDCGTNLTVEIVIDESSKKNFLYRYMVEKGKNILLDTKNIDKYVGKKIRLRSPMYCKGDKLCSICAGTLFYKIGIKNIGLTTIKMATSLLNLSMKNFHDTTIRVYDIDLNTITL